MSNLSLWVRDRASAPTHAPLKEDVETNTLVVGAGITGLTAAYALTKAGVDVRVIDGRLIASGATGFTTAKITALHTAVYAELRKKHGPDVTRLYADANQQALQWVVETVDALRSDCALERRDAVTYVREPSQASSIEDEVDAAREAGLPARLEHDIDVPFDIAAAVVLPDQAQFDPLPYLQDLAAAVVAGGGHIHEQTRAHGIAAGKANGRHRVDTDDGSITAERVLVCTGIPFVDRGLYFARMEPDRSYAVAARVRGELPQSMSISADEPTRSLRTAPAPDGSGQLLLVGGEGHVVGREPDTEARYQELIDWTDQHFGVERVEYRWSTQDYSPIDKLPFVGPARALPNGVSIATGFAKWGMTKGTMAGLALADHALGRETPWSDVFDAGRFDVGRAPTAFASLNGKVGWRMIADRLKTTGARVPDLDEGQAVVIRSGLTGRTGVSCVDGEKVGVSAICPHMGGVLAWNPAEQSWDCPIHGSRFGAAGELLQGPAVDDLERRTV